MNVRQHRWQQRRKRISEIVEMGSADDWVSRGYNILSLVMLLEGDHVILYTQTHISHADLISV